MRIGNLNCKISIFFKANNTPSFKGGSSPVLAVNCLKKLENVRCIYCGEIMLTNEQVRAFASQATTMKDRKLAKFLSTYEHNMKENEQQVLFFIKKAIENFPHCDLKGILEEMFPFHIKRLEAHQTNILKRIEQLSKGFNEHDRDLTKNFIEKGLEEIKNCGAQKHFRKNQFITDFYSLRQQFDNPQSHSFVREEISSMPSTHTSIDAFIVKYSRKGNFEIAQRLLSPSQLTIEHLLPQSKGGTNDLSNLALACGKDNSTRRNAPLDTMPQIRIHFQDFAKTVRSAMAKKYKGDLIKEYLNGVRETVDNLLTEGLNLYKD